MHDIRPEKASKVAELQELLKDAKGVVFVNYSGLTVADDTKLRSSMRAAGVTYAVAKNTFIRIAAKAVGIEGLESILEHNTAIAVSPADPVAAAKILNDFSKDHKALEIKGGLLDGKQISVEEVKALAALPSREELLAKMLGSMQAPMSGLVNVLQGTIRNFVYVLEAVRKEKEKQSA
jgi:large subunit ribosomal protein L10